MYESEVFHLPLTSHDSYLTQTNYRSYQESTITCTFSMEIPAGKQTQRPDHSEEMLSKHSKQVGTKVIKCHKVTDWPWNADESCIEYKLRRSQRNAVMSGAARNLSHMTWFKLRTQTVETSGGAERLASFGLTPTGHSEWPRAFYYILNCMSSVKYYSQYLNMYFAFSQSQQWSTLFDGPNWKRGRQKIFVPEISYLWWGCRQGLEDSTSHDDTWKQWPCWWCGTRARRRNGCCSSGENLDTGMDCSGTLHVPAPGGECSCSVAL